MAGRLTPGRAPTRRFHVPSAVRGSPARIDVASAWHAARAGAPVVQPSDLLPPGPHRHDGHTLVFWAYLVQAGKLDATAAGRGLHTIHDSLADYDGELPRAGRAEEVRAMLQAFAPSDDVDLLCELASRELPEGQALHGDAHLFNCIQHSPTVEPRGCTL